MKLLKQYLFKTYSGTFFPIFLILFIITSIVFLIKIATLTSIIQINFLELMTLYSYTMPTILFYILPVSIFISLSLAIAKLSSDYELIVITSFGLNPLKLLKHILIHLISVTLLLLVISLVLIPKAQYLNSEFLEKKKSEAQFNINPSEFGQKFGDWFIYVNGKKDNNYSDIVLFKNDQKKDERDIIIANNAQVQNVKGDNLALDLYSGKAFYIQENIKQIDFNTMTINNKIERIKLINTFDDVVEFWKRMNILKPIEREFTFNVLYSLFPLISILFVITIGYFNPRYDKNNSTVLALTLITVFVVAGQKLSNSIGLYTLYTLPLVWLLLSGFYYKLKVKSYY